MMPPTLILAEYILREANSNHEANRLRDEFAAAVAHPDVQGAVVQFFLDDILAGDFDDIGFALAVMRPDQLVHFACLPLPPPPDAPKCRIAGALYPLSWTRSFLVSWLDAMAEAIGCVTGEGFSIHGARLIPSIASITPCGAAYGFFSDDPGAQAAWAAAGYPPDGGSLADPATHLAAHLPAGAAISLPMFQPGKWMGDPEAVFKTAPGAVAMDLTFEATLDHFVSKLASNGAPFALQLRTGDTPAPWFAAAQNLPGVQWIEVHQDQAALVFGNTLPNHA